jgi:RimJ/RimL family protein N-acetyltransferase
MLLKGKSVKLVPLREDDIPILASWYENVDFLRFYDFHPALPKTEAQLRKIYKGADSDKFIALAVREIESDALVGLVELDGISHTNRFAWISIGLGNEKSRGRGYGYEAMSLAIDYAFKELNLERLQLNVISYNEAGIRLYEKLGFIKEGVYRKAVLRDSRRHDLYLYGLLGKEWNTDD